MSLERLQRNPEFRALWDVLYEDWLKDSKGPETSDGEHPTEDWVASRISEIKKARREGDFFSARKRWVREIGSAVLKARRPTPIAGYFECL
jgi:hypothetical protein